jgi:hypothetical protein
LALALSPKKVGELNERIAKEPEEKISLAEVVTERLDSLVFTFSQHSFLPMTFIS